MNNSADPIRLAVITGGHGFDVPNFHRLFRRLDRIDAYVQTMGDFAASPQETRDRYAGIVFYHMLTEMPADEGKTLAAVERLKVTGQGIVALHHSLLAYPEWPTWRELTGIDPTLRSYQHDQPMKVQVVGVDHPITAGLGGFALVDETYRMGEPDAGNEILLTTEHANSLKALGWVRRFGRARVFSLVLGHDQQAWGNPGFEEVLGRGIRWAVGGKL